MPGPNRPRDRPPDLPPEYAEAYLRGFERTYNERTGELPVSDQGEPDSVDSETSTTPSPVAERRSGETGDDRHRLVVPAILVILALFLVLAAYGLGKLFSSEVAGADATSREPADGVVVGDDSGPSEGAKEGQSQSRSTMPRSKPYDGEVSPVQMLGADASCTSDPSIDAAGNEVSYEVGNVYDRDPSTAWRCDGSGVGAEVTIDIPQGTGVVELGLIPGYAKTDPVDGADRYAENNRITRVRWVFAGEAGGAVITQKFDGSARNRSMQTMRIPATEASRVTIEILMSTRGTRSDTVALGEVALGEAALGEAAG